jgi:hypothetical protein
MLGWFGPGVASKACVHIQSDRYDKQDTGALPEPPGWAESPVEGCRERNARLQHGPGLRVSHVD